jgi:hypothetical protein
MRKLVLLASLATFTFAFAGDLELTEQNWREQRKKIAPAQEELAFEKVGWRPSFLSGVFEAQEKDRPLLIWVMNGHPLGCT